MVLLRCASAATVAKRSIVCARAHGLRSTTRGRTRSPLAKISGSSATLRSMANMIALNRSRFSLPQSRAGDFCRIAVATTLETNAWGEASRGRGLLWHLGSFSGH